jgi:cytochrome P450
MAVEADVPRMTPSKLDSGIIVKDPPDHTRLRRLVAKAFTQRRVEQPRVRIRELAEELVDAVAARGMPVDLVEHFASSLPVVVICELLGVPAPTGRVPGLERRLPVHEQGHGGALRDQPGGIPGVHGRAHRPAAGGAGR